MSDEFHLEAEAREDVGKGASRRLRRVHDRVPAIIYGGHDQPRNISLPLNELKHALNNEAFFSHILTIKVGGQDTEEVLIRDLQRNPRNGFPIHADFMRVVKGEPITQTVPLHFVNEETAPGAKLYAGKFQHNMTEVNVSCLPHDLPEHIEVDVGEMQLDEILHMSDLKLPKGVEIVELQQGEEHDQPVVALHVPKRQAAAAGAGEEGEEGDEEAGSGEEDEG
jgi:large subunit ribosomal protein L25